MGSIWEFAESDLIGLTCEEKRENWNFILKRMGSFGNGIRGWLFQISPLNS